MSKQMIKDSKANLTKGDTAKAIHSIFSHIYVPKTDVDFSEQIIFFEYDQDTEILDFNNLNYKLLFTKILKQLSNAFMLIDCVVVVLEYQIDDIR